MENISSQPNRQFWTTFTPRKLYWEAIQLKLTDSDNLNWQKWWEHPTFMYESMALLSHYGFTGIRLNVFNFELTTNGKLFDWSPLDAALQAAQNAHLQVDLCLGPIAYPLWPGLRLPPQIIEGFKNKHQSSGFLDQISTRPVKEFALRFIHQQMTRYANDNRIHGFYLSNEWPNRQQLEDQEDVWGSANNDFMQKLVKITSKHLDQINKPIIMNTNFNPYETRKIIDTYSSFWRQASTFALALDVYPSQETWVKSPQLRYRRWHSSFAKQVNNLQSKIPVPLIYGELEAQPWASGQSWKDYFLQPDLTYDQKRAPDFNSSTLIRTYRQYVWPTKIKKVTWWGSEFWLIAALLGINWPLETLSSLKRL